MKSLSLRMIIVAVIAAFAFAAVASAEPARGGHVDTNQPSLYRSGEMSAGLGFWGYWGGGINLTGSYFFTDNIAAQVDLSPVTYTPIAGGPSASVLVMDIMGVYHMSFADNFGAYGGLGLGIGSATIGGITYSVSGLAYAVGAEMFFTENIVGNIGIHSGSLAAGISMVF